MREIPLHKLAAGESATVLCIREPGSAVLEQLGILKGASIRRLYSSPLKDPAAYEIDGVVVALRQSDCERVMVAPERGTEITVPSVSRFDRLLTGPLTSFPVMLFLLMGIFWITIRGANYPSAFLSEILFSLEQPLYDSLCTGLGLPVFFCEMTACGMYRVLAWVISVILPPMAIFFPLFTLLEEWGLLPRVAFNLDRCFRCCGSCGKQALTLCMGFGCNASAVMECRILDSPRERLMAMVTNSLVPCNGRFPILICIITMYFSSRPALILTAVITASVAASFLLSKILSMTVLKGANHSFAMVIPPLSRPEFGRIILQSILERTLVVLARAVVAAAPAGMIIYILANIMTGDSSLLEAASAILDPFGRLIGLDGVILLAFILGLPANEIVLPVMMMCYMKEGMLTEVTNLQFFHQLLTENGWTGLTALNVMIFTLMHWPCAATLLTIRKESGCWKWTAASILAPLVMGVMFCGITTAIYCKL